MFECIQVAKNTYYIASPVNIGIYIEDTNKAWIIDSGLDARIAKKIEKILLENNWELKAIINTHSHADHIGGNKYLQDKYQCPVYANGLDCLFIEHTFLSPMALWGAYPPHCLLAKSIMAEESKATDINTITLPQGFEVIPLYGHGLFMVAIKTPDNILFIADELCSQYVLDKYGVPFNYHIEDYVKSLEKAKTLCADLFIPAHGQPTKDILPLIDANILAVQHIKDFIYTCCETPVYFDKLMQMIFNHFGHELNFVQYAVVGCAVRSYLTWLYDSGEIEPISIENMLYWQQKQK